jgi:chemotaxis protein MotB
MTKRTRNFSRSAQTQDFWPSYTDVMSTVAMLLFFLMLLAYIQSILTGRQLASHKAELDKTSAYLLLLNADLDIAKIELDASNLELDESKIDLETLMQKLEDARWTLMTNDDEIERQNEALKYLEAERESAQTAILEGQALLDQSMLEIESQRGVIAMSNLELGELRIKLSDIAVLRVSILEKVSKSIEDEIGKYTETGEERVAIGPNANIVINETLLFDYASAVVKDDAKQLLDQLAIAFERLLDDPETRAYIDYVSIEGHTDSSGSAGFNRGLSAERAVSVVNYMMESNPNLEEKYAAYFGTGGFSKFRPLELGEDDDSMSKNRRIEISIVVKDENIRGMIEEYLGDIPQ